MQQATTSPQPHHSRSFFAQLALLSGLGVLLNQVPLSLFFGVHLLLGSIPAVLMVLLWRSWWSVPMATLASLATIPLWGHPYAVLIFTAEAAWLCWACRHWLSNREPLSHRIILFSIVFWVAIGTPLVFATYQGLLGISTTNTTLIAVKQSVNGVLNTTAAYLIAISINAGSRQRRSSGIAIRNLITGLTLILVLTSYLLATTLSSRQIGRSITLAERDRLSLVASITSQLAQANALDNTVLNSLGDSIAVEVTSNNGPTISSNPAQFAQVYRNFTVGAAPVPGIQGLSFYRPKQTMPALKSWVSGYWSFTTTVHTSDRTSFRVTVLEPASEMVLRLQKEGSHLLASLAVLILLSYLLSVLLSRWFREEFQRVLSPFISNSPNDQTSLPLQSLGGSSIDELSMVVDVVNERIATANQLTQDLAHLSRTDPLTNCLNRREMYRVLEQHTHHLQRANGSLICITIDLDHFKQINDTYGHEAGDAVLVAVTQRLHERLRRSDQLFRVGGEEFIVLITDPINTHQSLSLTESLRQLIADQPVNYNGQHLSVTASFGVAHWRQGSDNVAELLKRSDQAVYAAKANGRNRVVQYDIKPPSTQPPK